MFRAASLHAEAAALVGDASRFRQLVASQTPPSGDTRKALGVVPPQVLPFVGDDASVEAFIHWLKRRNPPSDATSVVITKLQAELQECAGGGEHRALAHLMQQAAARRAGTALLDPRQALGITPEQLAGPGQPMLGPNGVAVVPAPTVRERRTDIIQAITLTRRLIA